jgi:hypothetical protein
MNKGLKITALIFYILANASILAHAVICHHHDNIQLVGHCSDRGCHESIEDCSLSIIYVKFDNNRQIVQLRSFDFDLQPCVFVLFPDHSTPTVYDDIGLPCRQKPYLISYYTDSISQSPGLRAPPAC